jgi:hypothetical protein
MRVVLMILGLVAVCAGSVQANGIDPGVIIVGGRGSLSLTGPTVTVTYPGQTGCTSGSSLPAIYSGASMPTALVGLPFMDCVFGNDSVSPAISNLVINVNTAQLPLTLQCATLCSGFSQTPTGGTITFYFNPAIQICPTAVCEFRAVFVNFTPGTTFEVRTNVPEPGALALLGTGLLGIATRLRRKKVTA